MPFKKGSFVQGLNQGLAKMKQLKVQQEELNIRKEQMQLQKDNAEFAKLAKTAEYGLNILSNPKLSSLHASAGKGAAQAMKTMGILPEGFDISKLNFDNDAMKDMIGEYYEGMKRFNKGEITAAELEKLSTNIQAKAGPEIARTMRESTDNAITRKRQGVIDEQDRKKQIEVDRRADAKLKIEQAKLKLSQQKEERESTAGGHKPSTNEKELASFRKDKPNWKGNILDYLQLKELATTNPLKASLLAAGKDIRVTMLNKMSLEEAAKEYMGAWDVLTGKREAIPKLPKGMTGEDYTDMKKKHPNVPNKQLFEIFKKWQKKYGD